jgi:hypothetical protein
MLYLPHFLTGAAILHIVPNPIVGLPLAFVSHIVLDLTPHNDFDLRPGITMKEFLYDMEKGRRNLILAALMIDYTLTAIAFFWMLFRFHNPLLLAGGIIGVSPDAFEQLLMLFGKALPGWQDKLQNRVSMKYGFISYPIVSCIALYILLK